MGLPATRARRRGVRDALPLWVLQLVRAFIPSPLYLSDTRSFFFFRWIYASTLAYIVDANAGRSSTAVATNSAFRGVFAFIAAEVAVPLQVSFPAQHFPSFKRIETLLECDRGWWDVHPVGGPAGHLRAVDSACALQGTVVETARGGTGGAQGVIN